MKVEEVDLDSASEEDDDFIESPGTFQFPQAQDIVRNGEKRKEREEDGVNPPLLTLQSFARIPVPATQDTIPSLTQNSTLGFPVPCNDERRPHLEPSGKYYFENFEFNVPSFLRSLTFGRSKRI